MTPAQIAKELLFCFRWDTTEKGSVYWQEVYSELQMMEAKQNEIHNQRINAKINELKQRISQLEGELK